jgi:hypothetical protein
MSDILYVDKSQSSPYDPTKWNAQDANEVKNAVNTKVDKVTGKQLSSNDYTSAEKTKLSAIQDSATANDTDANLKNRANHTGTQAATTIVEDSTHRFATDAEKTAWNAKQAALPSQTGNNGKVLGTDGTNLSWVAGGSGSGGITDVVPTDGSTNPVQSNGVFDALALKADLASPALTGNPTTPNQTTGNNTTRIANTAFVQQEITSNAIYFDNTQFSGTGSSGSPIQLVGGGSGGGSGSVKLAASSAFSMTSSSYLIVNLSLYTSYNMIKIKLFDVISTASTDHIHMQVSTDNGATYDSAASAYIGQFARGDGSQANAGGVQLVLTDFISNIAGEVIHGEIQAFKPQSNTNKPSFRWEISQPMSDGTHHLPIVGAGRRNAIQDTTHIRLFTNGGTITGFYEIWGE